MEKLKLDKNSIKIDKNFKKIIEGLGLNLKDATINKNIIKFDSVYTGGEFTYDKKTKIAKRKICSFDNEENKDINVDLFKLENSKVIKIGNYII